MVEIHYHLLPAVDDGAKSIEESIEMVNRSIAEGVTHLVCTPHANHRFGYRQQLNLEKLAQIQEAIGGKMKLGIGCDFHLSQPNLEQLFKYPSRFTINGKQYLLVELPEFGFKSSIVPIIADLVERGLVPVITHPERNSTLAANPSFISVLINLGCLVQITAGSLLGRFGRRARSISCKLIENRCAHFVSSDAHDVQGRGPCMRPAYTFINAEFGKERATELCESNPFAAFQGHEVSREQVKNDAFSPERRRSFGWLWARQN